MEVLHKEHTTLSGTILSVTHQTWFPSSQTRFGAFEIGLFPFTVILDYLIFSTEEDLDLKNLLQSLVSSKLFHISFQK